MIEVTIACAKRCGYEMTRRVRPDYIIRDIRELLPQASRLHNQRTLCGADNGYVIVALRDILPEERQDGSELR